MSEMPGCGASLSVCVISDDNWGENPHSATFNKSECNWGPSEIEQHCLIDMDLDEEEVADITAAWKETMTAVYTAVLDHGGFSWPSFSGGGITAANCASELRASCKPDAYQQTSAMMFEVALADHGPSNLTQPTQDLAAFLVSRGPYAWIGTSWVGCEPTNGVEGGRINQTYARPAEWDVDYGTPNGLCSEVAGKTGALALLNTV